MLGTERIPIRFFIITFAWSWILWLPLVLCGFGIIPLSKDIFAAITVPVIGLGAFGPAVGALCSLRTTKGKGAIRTYLKSFLNRARKGDIGAPSTRPQSSRAAISFPITSLLGVSR